jgi:hypothetical protein
VGLVGCFVAGPVAALFEWLVIGLVAGRVGVRVGPLVCCLDCGLVNRRACRGARWWVGMWSRLWVSRYSRRGAIW